MPDCLKIIANISILKSLCILWFPAIIFLYFGYYSYGGYFFTLNHWINTKGTIVTPVIGIPCIIITLTLIIIQSYYIAISNGIWAYIENDVLYVYNGKNYRLSEIDGSSVCIEGWAKTIITFYYRNKKISLPIIFSADKGSAIKERFIGSLRSNKGVEAVG